MSTGGRCIASGGEGKRCRCARRGGAGGKVAVKERDASRCDAAKVVCRHTDWNRTRFIADEVGVYRFLGCVDEAPGHTT